MKHLKHLFTALIMLCATAVAAHDFEVGGIYYNILSETDKTVEVTCRGTYTVHYSNEYTGNVVIPESVTYNGTTYSVTSIGYDAFEDCTGLTNITIPNSVTSIGNDAFSGCTGLTNITIPNSVTSIGNSAFRGCTGLTSIEIPSSVTSIGDDAFYYCTGLTSIIVDDNNTKYDSRENCNAIIETETNTVVLGCKNTVIPSSVTSIEACAFSGCKGLTNITIPSSVTSIGDDAFYYCTGLTSIIVDDNNTKYDSRENCNAIIETETNTLVLGCKNTVIPSSVTSIGYDAFYYCTGLTSIEIPNSVTSIGDRAFYYCTGLTSIEIPNSVTSIGRGAFNGTAWYNNQPDGLVYAGKVLYEYKGTMPSNTSITIKDETLGIAGTAFYYCTGLTSIEIPNSVTSIGDYAFYYCKGLTSIKIPNSVTSIGDGAFEDCTGLTSVTIPNSVTSIGSDTFNGCTGLTSIIIPNSVTSIGDEAFYGCKGLTSIIIPNSVTSIGDEAFYGCKGLKTIYNFSNLTFSKGSSSNGYVAWYADKVYNAPNGFIDGDFIWYENEDGMTLAGYLGNATELALPADYNGKSVTSIGDEVFRGCTGLTSIEIPNSVTSIEYYAFYGCTGLTSVVIGNSVTSIGDDAFEDCTGLKEVHITDLAAWCGIDFSVKYSNPLFYACNLYLNGELVTDLVIPDNVTNIRDNAFYNCTGLTSITIPNSVTSIGSNAFNGCTGLKTVYNFSNLTFSKGSSSNGYVAWYADKVYNAPNGSIEGDFIFGKPNDVNTLVGYLGNATELTLPAGYNGENYAIGAAVFQNYTGLAAELIIHNNITGIGASAFKGCNNIEKLYIGSSVESIGDKAFAGCEKITEIKVALEKPIKGSDDIFANAVYDNATLYIPNGTEQLYQKREPWNIFFDIVEIDFTGIEDVYDEVKGENGKLQTIYDLQGRKVEVPSEGLYIINGKKVLIK